MKKMVARVHLGAVFPIHVVFNIRGTLGGDSCG